MPKPQIFENEKQKKQAIISALQALKEHLGWKIIVMVLETDIKEAEAKLHGDEKLEEGETIEFWQQVRKDRQAIKDLPDLLMGESINTQGKQRKLSDFDPYEQ